MDEFCGSPLWQYNLTWNITSQPDLTPCFQETLLIWIPCLILWFFTPLEIVIILNRRRSYIPVTILNLFKAFLSTVLCLLSVAELIAVLYKNDNNITLVEYVAPSVRSLTYILAFGLTIFYRNRGVNTSGLMLLFWLLLSVASIINIRSLLRSTFQDHTTNTVAEWHFTELQFTLRLVAFPIVIIQLVLACIADKKAQDPFVTTGGEFRDQSPENDASILSLITFWWLNSLMWLGYKRALTQEDLYPLKPSDKTEVVCRKFDELLQPDIDKALSESRVETFTPNLDGGANKSLTDRGSSQRSSWIPLVRKRREPKRQQRYDEKKEEEKNQKEELAKHVGVTSVIFRAFWPRLLLSAFLKLFSSLLTFSSPLLLSKIISFTETKSEPDWRGVFYATSLFLLSITESFFSNREQYLSNLNVMRVRTCVTSALYRKTLRLSNEGRLKYTTGQIVNLMAIDAQRISDIVQNVNSLWSAPIQLIISMVLLYQQLGVAIFAGLGFMLINIPFNAWIALRLRQLQQMVMRYKDKRIKLLSEMFGGIKIVKIHAWEDSFKNRIEAFRNSEIFFLKKQISYSAAITFAFTCLPFVVALTSFATYILIDANNILDAKKIFVSISLLNIIRLPLAVLPLLITNLSMYLVAVRRMNKFLEAEEIDLESIKQIDDDVNVIKIENGSFKWDRKGEVTLDKINFTVPRRKLVAVVGPVGTGKSSLLSTILGDLETYEGETKVDLRSSMAYVPQEAWILNTTFRNNIMFNKVVNEDKYQRVIEACALTSDLKTFELGDHSEIGEKGLNLSGGQKQRISLARAVYADSDIYILDDPLNAVDAHVGRHIFEHIIGPKGMLRDRTRVLVTNKLSILPEVDYIYVLKDGQISESGTYEQLLKNRGLFSQLLVTYLLENDKRVDISSESARTDLITKELKRLEENEAEEARKNSPIKKVVKNLEEKNLKLQKETPSETHNLTGKEISQVGSVGLDVHMKFMRTMGINFICALAIYILSSAFTLSSNIWLSEWSNDAANPSLRNDTSQRNMRLSVYAGLGFAETFCVIVSTVLLNYACLRGSKLLHGKMLSRVLRAPMSWFNTTPSARIMNRFSKDIDSLDVTIRFTVRVLMVTAIRSVTSLILISLGSAYSIILIVPIVLLYFLFQIFYVATSRQLKRIESTTKSPIYSHFSETVSGATSIRAFGVSQEFILESNHRVDVNNASFYMGFVSARWLAMRLEFLGFIMVFTTSMIAALSRDTISPGIAGLSVTYSLTVTAVLSFLVRTYSDYETNVVSVERLLEYTRTPVEPDDEEEPTDNNWPSKGAITYDNYSARYRPELDLVLNKFSLDIKPAERVGLVGRTGAGKSSTTLALFRMFEAAEGSIIIDGINIGHINLKCLRSKLSIIPQDPILFTGTIRQNVDPTESFPDDQVWKAIDMAHLGNFLRGLPDGLDHEVSEGGSNFSVGQKQLFCLARTLIRRSKILVLDEATAAVDVETDNLIQQTIRKEFKNSTILTIAHRIETIQDYDKVIVMEAGRLVEQGTPASLIENRESKFHSLAKEAGLTK